MEITHVAGCNASSGNLSAPKRNLQKILKTTMLISLLKYVQHSSTAMSCLCWAAMNGNDSFPKMNVHATCFVQCYRMHYVTKVLILWSCGWYAYAYIIYIYTHTHSICIIEQYICIETYVPLVHSGGGVGGCSPRTPPPSPRKQNLKKHRFHKCDDIKGFTSFTFQPKSATEIGWWLVRWNTEKCKKNLWMYRFC
jgi:hypothetical protein